jgi:UDP-2-acetamido-2,6-beta-L-arabino-hexul-4-ose reductase
LKERDLKGQLFFLHQSKKNGITLLEILRKAAKELFFNWAVTNLVPNFKGLIIPNVFGAFGVPFYNSVVSTFCHQLVQNEIPEN